jgi:GNAT superfamily N-acetyltransferase
MEIQVVTFNPQFKPAFRDLNIEWIEKYFRVEPKDTEQVTHPEQCLQDGGEIFFVLADGEAVGTCAMYKTAENQFELAKMAVSPRFHKKGFGDLLMQAAEDWAREKKAREILILSNTVLSPAISLYHKHGFKTTHLGAHPDYERCNIEMRKQLD